VCSLLVRSFLINASLTGGILLGSLLSTLLHTVLNFRLSICSSLSSLLLLEICDFFLFFKQFSFLVFCFLLVFSDFFLEGRFLLLLDAFVLSFLNLDN